MCTQLLKRLSRGVPPSLFSFARYLESPFTAPNPILPGGNVSLIMRWSGMLALPAKYGEGYLSFRGPSANFSAAVKLASKPDGLSFWRYSSVTPTHTLMVEAPATLHNLVLSYTDGSSPVAVVHAALRVCVLSRPTSTARDGGAVIGNLFRATHSRVNYYVVDPGRLSTTAEMLGQEHRDFPAHVGLEVRSFLDPESWETRPFTNSVTFVHSPSAGVEVATPRLPVVLISVNDGATLGIEASFLIAVRPHRRERDFPNNYHPLTIGSAPLESAELTRLIMEYNRHHVYRSYASPPNR